MRVHIMPPPLPIKNIIIIQWRLNEWIDSRCATRRERKTRWTAALAPLRLLLPPPRKLERLSDAAMRNKKNGTRTTRGWDRTSTWSLARLKTARARVSFTYRPPRASASDGHLFGHWSPRASARPRLRIPPSVRPRSARPRTTRVVSTPPEWGGARGSLWDGAPVDGGKRYLFIVAANRRSMTVWNTLQLKSVFSFFFGMTREV